MIDAEFAEKIKTCPEIMLYFIIDGIGAMRWRLNHDMADGRIPSESHAEIDKSIGEMAEKQHAAVGQLTRFGVSPFLEDGKSPSPPYWEWFRKWDNYIKNVLTEEEYSELERKLSCDEDLSQYVPEDRLCAT